MGFSKVPRVVQDWSRDVLARLVATPSITGRPSTMHHVLSEVLRELGFGVCEIACDPRRFQEHPQYSPPTHVAGDALPALLARKPDPCNDPRVLLFAHTDTEPVHGGWTSDPFSAERRDGRITGLGVADDLSGVVNILAALRTVQDADAPLTIDPVVALAPGKQGGALGMLPAVAAAGAIDAALYLHPQETGAGLAELKTASRGVARFTLQVPGLTPLPREERTPVSADPAEGENAAARAVRLADRLAADAPGRATWAVTRLAAGGDPFEIPSQATVEFAAWFTDGEVGDRLEELERWLHEEPGSEWERGHPVHASLIGLRANPARCSATGWHQSIASAVEAVTGSTPTSYLGHSASDIRFPLLCSGAPAVGLGPRAGGFYGPGEWIDEDSWHTTTAIVAELITGDWRP